MNDVRPENDTRLPLLSVLMVEDSEDDAILITEQLKEQYEPYILRVTGREEMAVALAERDWDVVISDHSLPDFSAIEALRLVVDTGHDIPFVIVSGTIGEALAIEAMKAGAHDFLMKDSLAKLNPAVEHAVAAGNSRRSHRKTVEQLHESRERLRQLALHLETVRESERACLAREIHDELGGILTALKMDISWLRRRSELSEPRLNEKLGSMTELLDGAINSMRQIITELRPSILDDLGLIAAVEWQLNEFRKRTGLQTELVLDKQVELYALKLPAAFAIAAFRTLQESLTNIARHANATIVIVCAAVEDGIFSLKVRDNGRGIGPGQLQKIGSYGVLGMRERALNLDGMLVIDSDSRGTLITLTLPLASCEVEVAE